MSVVTQPTTQSGREDELTPAQILSQMQELREQMDRDQAEIERLKSETRALKVETRALLSDLKSAVQPC